MAHYVTARNSPPGNDRIKEGDLGLVIKDRGGGLLNVLFCFGDPVGSRRSYPTALIMMSEKDTSLAHPNKYLNDQRITDQYNTLKKEAERRE